MEAQYGTHTVSDITTAPSRLGIQVFDDVLGDRIEAYRRFALAQDFQTIHTGGEEFFHGIAVIDDEKLTNLIRLLVPSWQSTRVTFFRKSPYGQVEPNFIHSDQDMGEATAILYLNPNPPADDGTVFWRYKPTGQIFGHARELSKDPDLWEPWRRVQAQFGRLLVYDSLYFHSRAIEDNYGDGDNARLTQCAFGRLTSPDGVRRAVVDDVPRLIEMGLRFQRESIYADRLPYDITSYGTLAQQLIEGDESEMFVWSKDNVVVGMIGLQAFTHDMTGERTVIERVFWVEPEHRGVGIRLLKRAEQWARLKGAVSFQMIAPTRATQVRALYERLGFSELEVGYEKRLDAAEE